MKKIKCKNCGAKLDKDAKFCECCGCKVEKGNDLDEKEVSKNVFGLLAMFIFMFTALVFTGLPILLSNFNINVPFLSNIAYIGYLLAIVCELLGLLIYRRDKSIDMQSSGLNYGSAAMIFSLFMIAAKFIGFY